MPVGTNASALAAQREAIRPDMPQLMLFSSIFWGRLDVMTNVTAVGSRPTRIPTNPLQGNAFSVPAGGNFDGGPLGRGQGPQEVPAYASCASYIQASEWTLQADYSTDSSAKAIESYVSLTHEQMFKTFGGNLDVCAQMDGSNTIDTIVSVTTGGLVVNNANKFQSGQSIDVWTSVGGAKVATLSILVSAINTNTLWIRGAVPGTVLAGMSLLVAGSSGQANSGMLGLLYYDVSLDVGNYLGIPRASYPSLYVANGINLNGQALTPSVIRAMQVLGVFAKGAEADDIEPVVHCGPDMTTAWEANYLGVQTATREGLKGNQSADMLPEKRITTIGGREVLENPRATFGRIDFINLKDYKRLETKPVDFLAWGGQTELPVIATDGGAVSATICYIGCQTQLICDQPRRQSFVSGAAIPKYMPGH